MAGVFTIRTVVVSSAPSAAKDGAARTRLAAPASARVVLTPAAPANAALVRNRRRLWIGIEHLPDPNGWITMSLAPAGRFAPSGSSVGRASVSPGLVTIVDRCRFARRETWTLKCESAKLFLRIQG